MLTRKIEALERRLHKMMSKDEDSLKKWGEAHKFVKAALDHANEGDHKSAYEAITRFNTMMLQNKLNGNV